MKKLSSMLGAVVLAFSAFLGGCALSHHGHLAWIAPPLVMAAVVASRPGSVWVDGHWDWVDGRWSWSQGYWMAGRPGFIWEQGGWIHGRNRYEWRPGRWREHRSEAHEHQR